MEARGLRTAIAASTMPATVDLDADLAVAATGSAGLPVTVTTVPGAPLLGLRLVMVGAGVVPVRFTS